MEKQLKKLLILIFLLFICILVAAFGVVWSYEYNCIMYNLIFYIKLKNKFYYLIYSLNVWTF